MSGGSDKDSTAPCVTGPENHLSLQILLRKLEGERAQIACIVHQSDPQDTFT